jgi:hypothetical protein
MFSQRQGRDTGRPLLALRQRTEPDLMNGETLLSKWWKTDSARAAFERVERARQERIQKVREQFEARRQALAREVENWQVKL